MTASVRRTDALQCMQLAGVPLRCLQMKSVAGNPSYAPGWLEEGVRLSRRGAEILDQAERRVELLRRVEGGGVEAVPMPLPALAGDGDGPA